MIEQPPTMRSDQQRATSTIPTRQVAESSASANSTPVEPSEQSQRLTVGQLLVAVFVALLVTAIWRKVLPLSKPRGDAVQYLKMATNPSQAVLTPYAYRVVVPYLTHRLGGIPQITFDRISLTCMVAAGPVVYTLARRLGAVHWAALLAMVGLLSTRAWTYYLYNPWLSDPAAMLLVAVGFLVLVSGWTWLLLAPLGVVFAGVRELFVGLVAPAFGWLRSRFGSVRAALGAGLLLLPGWLVYQWIIGSVPTRGTQGVGQISWQTVVAVGRYVGSRGGMRFFLVAAITLSLGCWWILAVASSWDPKIRRLLLWLVPVFGQFLLGGDWGRFALYAFPVVIPAAALTLQRLQPLWRGIIVTILGLQALTPLLDMAAGRMTLARPGPAVPVTVLLMALTTMVLVVAVVSERRNRQEPVDSRISLGISRGSGLSLAR
jgi:hypothetical protein